MSQDDSFFDNLWDAGENLVDAAEEAGEGFAHGAAAIYHGAAAAVNAVGNGDAEDRQEMIDHYDAANEEAVASRAAFGEAWDEIF